MSADLTRSPAWLALKQHAAQVGNRHLRELFAADPQRGERLVIEDVGLYLDYAKQRVNADTMELLRQLAEARGVRQRTAAMFAGERINTTEDRAVLHVALRAPAGERILFDGHDVVAGVHAVLDRMAAFSDQVRDGAWRGHTGKRIRNVVSIGIGGSDLGPVMAYEALRDFSQRDMVFRFVSNVDGTDFAEAVRDLDAAETLFIVCSKTFTTLETLSNAQAARQWAVQALGDESAVATNFVAVPTTPH
jgi:glucose-6-phosphate isomerase